MASAKTAPAKSTHFKYRARAVGLHGQLTLPVEHVIQPQAVTELPRQGGYLHSRVDSYRLEHFISFDSAYTSVTGAYSEKDDAFFTVTTSTIEGLDILGVITAGKIVARVMSRHPYVASKQSRVEPSIVPTGCHFDNLTIAGHRVNIRLHNSLLCDLDTFSKARDHGPQRLGTAFHRHDREDEAVHCTLVDSIDFGNAPELHRLNRNAIHIDQFGTIYFGELVANPFQRSVTMLRVILGCANEGILAVGSGEGNGSADPPASSG